MDLGAWLKYLMSPRFHGIGKGGEGKKNDA